MNKIAKRVLRRFDRYDLGCQAQGGATFFSKRESDGAVRKWVSNHNLIVYSGADALAKCLTGDWKLGTLYFEFKNLPDPDDPITPPAFDRSDGIAYYNGLASSPDTDFLRIPITVPPAFSASSESYLNNQVTFFALSEGATGFFGKTFSEAVNSAVYGGALIISPDPGDQSQDVVFSRTYSGIDKILKEAGFQIGVTWAIRFN